MFGIFGKGDPLRDVVKRSTRLTKVIVDARKRMGHDGNTMTGESDLLAPLVRPHDDLRRHLGILRHRRKTIGQLSPFDVNKLVSSYQSLLSTVRAINRDEEKWPRMPPSVQPIRRELTRDLKKLGSAISRLVRQVDKHTKSRWEGMDPIYDRPIKLRQAIKILDKRLAKEISPKDLEAACWEAPEIDWDDPKQVGKKAQIWLLTRRYNQWWEI